MDGVVMLHSLKDKFATDEDEDEDGQEEYFVKMVGLFDEGSAVGPFWFFYDRSMQMAQYFEDAVRSAKV